MDNGIINLILCYGIINLFIVCDINATTTLLLILKKADQLFQLLYDATTMGPQLTSNDTTNIHTTGMKFMIIG
jgi:hypothetical protein